MERHGSWSKGTIGFWKALLHRARTRQKASEFSSAPVRTETLDIPDAGSCPETSEREPHPAVPPPSA